MLYNVTEMWNVFEHSLQFVCAMILSAGSCPWHFVHTAILLNRSFTLDPVVVDAVSERHFLLLGFQEICRFGGTIKICCQFFSLSLQWYTVWEDLLRVMTAKFFTYLFIFFYSILQQHTTVNLRVLHTQFQLLGLSIGDLNETLSNCTYVLLPTEYYWSLLENLYTYKKQ